MLTGNFLTQDAEQLVESTKPWELRINQLSPARFQNYREYIQLGGFIIYRSWFKTATWFEGVSPPGYYMFGASVSSLGDMLLNGRHLGQSRLAFSTHRRELGFCVPVDTSNLVILAPEKLLNPILESNGFEPHPDADSLLVGANTREQFCRLFGQRFDSLFREHRPASRISKARIYYDTMLEVLNACFCANADDPGDLTHARAWKLILDTLDILESRPGDISVPELSALTGVSTRTLQKTFRDILGVPVTKLDNLLRLNGAYRDLSRAKARDESVTGIAENRGFSELGRFSVSYRTLFGEKPSATLSRAGRSSKMNLADFCAGRPRIFATPG